MICRTNLASLKDLLRTIRLRGLRLNEPQRHQLRQYTNPKVYPGAELLVSLDINLVKR